MKFLKSNWFIVGLLASIGLAWVAPQAGAPGGMLHSEITVRAAVFMIFLVNGLILPTETIVRGLAKWKIHTFVHGFLFVLTPLAAMVLLIPFRGALDPSLLAGFILLSALPCTISTSIVYSVRNGGSLAPALFNATVANLAGVAIVPVVVGLLTTVDGGGVDIVAALRNTASAVLPPVFLGQILRQPARKWVIRQKDRMNSLNSLLILFIVYASFAGSVQSGLWAGLGSGALAAAAGLCILMLAAQWILAGTGVRLLRMDREDAVTAFVCATQKTLAAGIPLANAIFAGSSIQIGTALLPLLIFYALQLVAGDYAIKFFCPKAPAQG